MKTYAYGIPYALLSVTLITAPVLSQEKGKSKGKDPQKDRQIAAAEAEKKVQDLGSSQGKEKGIGKGKQKKEKKQKKRPSSKETRQPSANFGRAAGELPPGLEKYEEKHAGELPPGLEKQLLEKGHLPPGLQKGGKK